jgi:hypothetical protein
VRQATGAMTVEELRRAAQAMRDEWSDAAMVERDDRYAAVLRASADAYQRVLNWIDGVEAP